MKKLNGGQNKHIKLSKVGAEQAVSSDYLSTTDNQYNSPLLNLIFQKVTVYCFRTQVKHMRVCNKASQNENRHFTDKIEIEGI